MPLVLKSILALLILGLGALSAFATTDICEKVMEPEGYGSLQERYMDNVHMADYRSASELWDRTLYQPLQRHFLRVLQAADRSHPLHVVYIGVGPHAPLLSEALHRSEILSRIGKITLIDISERYLNQSAEILRRIAPQLQIETRVMDITDGRGTAFAAALENLAQSAASLSQIAARIEPKVLMAQMTALPLSGVDVPQFDADIVYSEMVATFTGTAAMLSFESEMARRFGNEPDFSAGMDQIHSRLRLFWQMYNEHSFQIQVGLMVRMASATGLISVATDVEKLFMDAALASIPSFTSMEFPGVAGMTPFDVGFGEEVFWNDEHHEEMEQNPGVQALLPHRHRIAFTAYRAQASAGSRR